MPCPTAAAALIAVRRSHAGRSASRRLSVGHGPEADTGHHLGDIPHDALEQRLFELAGDALVVTALDGTIQRVNLAGAGVAGPPRGPVRRRSMWALVDPPTPNGSARPRGQRRAAAEEFRLRSFGRTATCAGPRSVPRSTPPQAFVICRPRHHRAVTRPTPSASARPFRDAPTGIAFIGVGRRPAPSQRRARATARRDRGGAPRPRALEIAADPEDRERGRTRCVGGRAAFASSSRRACAAPTASRSWRSSPARS